MKTSNYSVFRSSGNYFTCPSSNGFALISCHRRSNKFFYYDIQCPSWNEFHCAGDKTEKWHSLSRRILSPKPKVKWRIGKIGEAFKQKRVIRSLRGSWVSCPSTRECGFLLPFFYNFSFLLRIKQFLLLKGLCSIHLFIKSWMSAIVKVWEKNTVRGIRIQ